MPAPPAYLMREMARARFHDFALRAPARPRLKQSEAFIDGITEAICAAWSQWQKLAALVGVVINGAVASGGKVLGPALGPLILARAPRSTPWARKRSAAIANTLGEAWMVYVASIRVPALASGVPTSLRSLSQVSAPLDQMSLLTRMAMALGRRPAGLDAALLDAVAAAFVECFRHWQATTMVTGVVAVGEVASMRAGGFR